MNISRVKRNLNKKGVYRGTDYLLTGCIIRQNQKGEFFYQAELSDLSAKSSVVISSLDEIEEIS